MVGRVVRVKYIGLVPTVVYYSYRRIIKKIRDVINHVVIVEEKESRERCSCPDKAVFIVSRSDKVQGPEKGVRGSCSRLREG